MISKREVFAEAYTYALARDNNPETTFAANSSGVPVLR